MRLSPKLVLQAQKVDPLLPLILQATKNLPEAKQELRWLREAFPQYRRLGRACWLRSHQYPLQYLLKTQPFLNLNVKCWPGVLIPRWETEEWCAILSRLLKRNGHFNATILDLCTGTGCIPLSLISSLKESKVLAVDISLSALSCFHANTEPVKQIARDNCIDIAAIQGDVLNPETLSRDILEKVGCVDLITANPPYISEQTFDKHTSLSVKRFEPHIALKGDLEFYGPIVELAGMVGANALVCEVGTEEQIAFVQNQAQTQYYWESTSFYDAAGNPRLVISWNPASKWSFLRNFGR